MKKPTYITKEVLKARAEEIFLANTHTTIDTTKTIYIVKYCLNNFGGNAKIIIFATKSNMFAKNYCDKFNRILNKWKNYYKQFDNCDWLEDENFNKFERWYQLSQIDSCYIDVIQMRNY
jgi:hypothetical protein